jgi:hypothetical protein
LSVVSCQLSVVGCRLPAGKDNCSGFLSEYFLKMSASIDTCPTDIDNFFCR